MMLYVLEAKNLLARLVRNYDLELVTDKESVAWREFPLGMPAELNSVYVRLKPLQNV